MQVASLPFNEKERLDALNRYQVLDSDFERAYDEITELAATICGTPIALISFVDEHRQWFKAKVGLEVRETPRDLAFCAHAILDSNVMVVRDALQDGRFFDNPLVTQQPAIRFYAGAPLVTHDGYALGTLCAIDQKPRELTPGQLKALEVLARQVVARLELGLALKELEASYQRQQELMASKDRIYSIIAHDLKAPFNGLIGFTELLKDQVMTMPRDEVQEIIRELHDSSQSTLSLIENLLLFANMETGTVGFYPRAYPLRQLVDQVVALLRPVSLQKGVHLHRSTMPDVRLMIDPVMMHSALQNVVSNAIKFCRPEGMVFISFQVVDGMLELTVADTGIGIEQERLKALLGANVSVNSQEGTSGEKGTGLGLLMTRQILANHQGKFRAESKHGLGSRFTLVIPLASE